MGLSARELGHLIKMKSAGKTNAEIADFYGVSVSTIKRHYRATRNTTHFPTKEKEKKKTAISHDFDYDSSSIEPEDELVVKEENVIVASDFHVPGENKAAIRQMMEYAREHGIKHLIINGDYWNNDAVSSWELKDPSMGLSREIQQGTRLMRMLLQHFTVYLVCGNHDVRMPRALSHSINYVEWMTSLFPEDVGKKLFVTNFDHLYLDSGDKTYRVCHPSLYSRIKGRTVSLLSQDIHENVIMGHQHFLSMSTNQTGKFLCIDCGCMCDTNAFLYKRASTSRFPAWENGFLHIKSGKARLMTWYTF